MRVDELVKIVANETWFRVEDKDGNKLPFDESYSLEVTEIAVDNNGIVVTAKKG